MTMYDTQTRSQLQTDQQFPTLGSQREGIKKNADGSIRHLLRARTAQRARRATGCRPFPGKSWFIALRMYGPLQPWIDQTWRPGELELVE